MKIMGIVQPLNLTSGYINGHWELPLGHRGVELWAESRVRLDLHLGHLFLVLPTEHLLRMGVVILCISKQRDRGCRHPDLDICPGSTG